MREPLIVVGILGKARSGKDTVSKFLESDRFGFFRVAQGDSIRAILLNLMFPSWEVLKEVEAAGQTHIEPLQKLGGECKRDIDREELWTDVTLAAISYIARFHPRPRTRIVIPGMRYLAEAVRFREQIEGTWGGSFRTWKLERGGAGLTGDRAKHVSEIEAEQVVCDEVIRNDGTKADLHLVVGSLLEKYGWD